LVPTELHLSLRLSEFGGSSLFFPAISDAASPPNVTFPAA
jgi:hypothetical protein